MKLLQFERISSSADPVDLTKSRKNVENTEKRERGHIQRCCVSCLDVALGLKSTVLDMESQPGVSDQDHHEPLEN